MSDHTNHTATYDNLMLSMRREQIVVLDGGTGTEIQRMGAAMDGRFWCAQANLAHPDVVANVHRAYLSAGAQVITANTYATSPLLFAAYGEVDSVNAIDRAAIDIARKVLAASPREACLAGSVSIMRPDITTAALENLKRDWPEHEVAKLYAEKARVLAEGGCDLILMEMMRDDYYSVVASQAALATALPVWIGLSAWRADAGSGLCGWERPDMPFDHVCRTLAALQPAAMGIMHTHLNDVDEALSLLQAHWSGPIFVYPELGHFNMPNWVYSEDLSPARFAELALSWIDRGVTAVGGCCGIGPGHISALREAIGDRAVRLG